MPITTLAFIIESSVLKVSDFTMHLLSSCIVYCYVSPFAITVKIVKVLTYRSTMFFHYLHVDVQCLLLHLRHVKLKHNDCFV